MFLRGVNIVEKDMRHNLVSMAAVAQVLLKVFSQ